MSPGWTLLWEDSQCINGIHITDGLYHKELTMHVIHQLHDFREASMHASEGLLGTALHVDQQP